MTILTFLCFVQAQEGEALLRFTSGSSTNLVEVPEPSETSHNNIRSSDPRLVHPGPPAHARTKHHSGSNVSFSHDTEGGEDDQNQVESMESKGFRAGLANQRLLSLILLFGWFYVDLKGFQMTVKHFPWHCHFVPYVADLS